MKHIVRSTSIALILLFAGASTLVRTSERMRIEAAPWNPASSAEHLSPASPANLQGTPESQAATESTAERNKALVLKWSDALRNKDLATAQALVTDDWAIHGAGRNFATGLEGLKQWRGYIEAMWANPHWTENDIFGEGDKVVRRITVYRTWRSNKESAMTVVFIYRIAGDKIAEVWRVADGLTSYQQIGAQIIMPGTNVDVGQPTPLPARPEKVAEQKISSTQEKSPQTKFADKKNTPERETPSVGTTENNKALVARWADAIWKKDLAVAQALVSDDCIIHAAGSTYAKGPEGIKQWLAEADSDWSYGGSTTDDVIAEGDKVARRTTVFAMYIPNHRGTVTSVIFIYRIADGKIAEVWRVANYVSTNLQAGAKIIMPGAKTEAGQAVSAKTQAEQEVLKAKQEFDDATLRNDADGRVRLYTDDFVMVYYNGQLGDKAKQLEMVRSGRFHYSALATEDVIVRVYGDSAVVIKRRKQVSTVAGQTRPGDVRVTQVWVKRQGQWQLVSGQVTPILEPAPAADKLPVKHVRANGAELAYVEKGEGGTIILVHGLISDYRTWGNQMDEFAKHFHVIAYSRRYHYPNSWTGDASDYTVDLHVRDLAALIKALNLGPVHLIGHSYGGRVATLVAIAHRELVRTLVVAETGFASLLKPKPEWQQAAENQKKVYEAVSEATRSGGAEAGLKMLFEFGGKTGAFDQLPAEQRQRYLDNARTLVPAWREQVQSNSNFACADASQIKAPVLWIESDSASRTTQLVGEEFARCNPQLERVTIPHSEHGMMHDNPAAFNQAVLAFLQKHSAATTQEASTFEKQHDSADAPQSRPPDPVSEQQLDAVKVDPKHYTIDFENDRVRLVRVQYGPHEKSAIMHGHPGNSVGVYVTDFHAKVTFPDGSTREVNGKAGKTIWRAPAVTHISTENLSDQHMEALWVELKPASAPVTDDANHAQDEAAIRKILADVGDAWRRQDAKAVTAHGSENHDHINVGGAWRQGRVETEKAMTAYFEAHRSNPSSVAQSVEKIRFITPDVAILVVRHKYSNDTRTWEAISTGVWHKMNGEWWNEAFQNTLIQSREEARAQAARASSPMAQLEPEVITPATSKTDFSGDVAAIRKMVADSVDAWNRRDPKANADHLSEEHDHISVIGGWRQGKAEIEKEWTAALATTRNSISRSIAKIRFITSDVAIVIARNEYTNDKETVKSITTSVYHKMNGEWWREAFQNTYVRPAADQTSEKKTSEPTP